MTNTDTADRTTGHLLAVLDDLAATLEQIPTDLDQAPTPCTDFTIDALRQHTIGWLTAFTDGFADADGRCSDAAEVLVAGTGAAAVRDLSDRLARALPAAAQRPLSIGNAAMPGELALSMMLWEYQMHGWDLAVATGQPWSPALDGVHASLSFAPPMLTPDFQGDGKSFAPRVAVPADADPFSRLLGLSGRDPQWTPPA